MNMAKLEMTVGVFMLIGMLCLGYVSIKLGKMEIMGGNYYSISAEFDSVSGLKPGARVEVAGVEVGKVDRIALDPKSGDRAVATIRAMTKPVIAYKILAAGRLPAQEGFEFAFRHIAAKDGGGRDSAAGGVPARRDFLHRDVLSIRRR